MVLPIKNLIFLYTYNEIVSLKLFIFLVLDTEKLFKKLSNSLLYTGYILKFKL